MLPRVVEESRAVKVIVTGACAYETVAITTGLVPTITRIHRSHPIVGWSIVAALAWHFAN